MIDERIYPSVGRLSGLWLLLVGYFLFMYVERDISRFYPCVGRLSGLWLLLVGYSRFMNVERDSSGFIRVLAGYPVYG